MITHLKQIGIPSNTLTCSRILLSPHKTRSRVAANLNKMRRQQLVTSRKDGGWDGKPNALRFGKDVIVLQDSQQYFCAV